MKACEYLLPLFVFSISDIPVKVERMSNQGFENLNSLGKADATLRKVPIYVADQCIEGLLRGVVEANRRFYNPKTHFYSLSYWKLATKRYLTVKSERYESVHLFDYVGAIKLEGQLFLCRGDIGSDPIFEIKETQFAIVFVSERNKSDSIPYAKEPSLQGAYEGCQGKSIDLEIYTAAAIPGFQMRHRSLSN